MHINVAQLLKEGTGAVRSYDIDDVLPLEDAPTDVAAPDRVEASTRAGEEIHVQGRATLTRAARGILLQGSFACQVRLTCGRCLTCFAHPVSFNVEEMFYPSIDILTGLPLALPDEDGSSSFTIDEHHLLDTGEMIRQYCLLAIPMKPLCRVDCAGLCPDCGANLNEIRCHCVRAPRTALAEALSQATALRQPKPSGKATEPSRAAAPGKGAAKAKSRRKMG